MEMSKLKLGGGLSLLLAIVSMSVTSAFALPWQGPLPIPVPPPPIKGGLTTIIKVGGLVAECASEEGTWAIVGPNEKDEGKVLDAEVAKYGECSASAPEKHSVTFSACAIEISREEGVFKKIKFALLKACSVKVSASCEVVLPVASNKALESLEVINLGGPKVEFVASVKNATDELKGTCPETIKPVKGTGEISIDLLIASELKAN
jgi:hypothetical protein